MRKLWNLARKVDVETDINLKRQYKTVLPVCNGCTSDEKKLITQRPYGKQQKNITTYAGHSHMKKNLPVPS